MFQLSSVCRVRTRSCGWFPAVLPDLRNDEGNFSFFSRRNHVQIIKKRILLIFNLKSHLPVKKCLTLYFLYFLHCYCLLSDKKRCKDDLWKLLYLTGKTMKNQKKRRLLLSQEPTFPNQKMCEQRGKNGCKGRVANWLLPGTVRIV